LQIERGEKYKTTWGHEMAVNEIIGKFGAKAGEVTIETRKPYLTREREVKLKTVEFFSSELRMLVSLSDEQGDENFCQTAGRSLLIVTSGSFTC